MKRLSWLVVLTTIAAAPAASAVATAQEADPLGDLMEKIQSEDAAVRLQAFDDLLVMGSEGLDALLAMLVEPGQGNDAGARFALHGMAARAAQPDEQQLRGSLVTALVAYLDGDAPAECKQFTIAQLQMAGGPESVPALASALQDEQLALTAIQALVAIPHDAASAALRDALPNTEGNVRVGIIQALGRRRDAKAVDGLLAQARGEATDARLAALEALGRIGDVKAAPVIYEALGKGEPRDQRRAFEACLLLGESLIASGDRAAAVRVYKQALQSANAPAEVSAGLLGMGKAASAKEVPTLVLFLTDAHPDIRHATAQCLAQLAGPEVGAALAEATRTASVPQKIELLRVLSQREEPAARRAIEAAAKDESPEVRVAACELLGRLDDPAIIETLLEVVEAEPGPIYEVAMRAFLHQARAQLNAGERDQALSMFQTALEHAKTDELTRLALDGIGAVGEPEAVALVERYLDNEAVREAALRAYVAIARTVAGADKDKGIEMLTKAIEMGPPRDVTQSAVARLRELGIDIDPAKASGFVTQWWVIGPFSGSNIDDGLPPEEGIDLSAAVKVDNRELKWASHHTTDPSGIVNLAGMMDPNTNTTAYLYAEVTVDQAQDVLFKTGSDDGMKLWLNGEEIHRFPHPRSLRVDEDTIEAQLAAGVNKILYKVVQGGGGWECCLRITDRDGIPLEFEQREQ